MLRINLVLHACRLRQGPYVALAGLELAEFPSLHLLSAEINSCACQSLSTFLCCLEKVSLCSQGAWPQLARHHLLGFYALKLEKMNKEAKMTPQRQGEENRPWGYWGCKGPGAGISDVAMSGWVLEKAMSWGFWGWGGAGI